MKEEQGRRNERGHIQPRYLIFMARGVGNIRYLKRGVICWGLSYCLV